MSNILRPDGDVGQSGQWERVPADTYLWEVIEEIIPDDADYIWANNVSGSEYFEISLSDPSPAVKCDDASIKWRAKKLAGGKDVTIKCELRDGTIVLSSDSQILSSDWRDYLFHYSGITNWNNLRLRFIVESVGGTGAPPDPAISWTKAETGDYLPDWGRRCAIVIDNTNVDSDLSNFPVLVHATGGNYNGLPSEMFDADGSYPALEGGGDIRFSSDEAGSGESQPAEDAAYGREAVWDSDYEAVWHLAESGNPYKDATSNDKDSAAGTYPAQATGKIYKGQNFDDASYEYIDFGAFAEIKNVANITISCWYKRDAANDVATWGVSESDSSDCILVQVLAGTTCYPNMSKGGDSIYATFTIDNDTSWHYMVLRYNGGGAANADRLKMFYDGANQSLGFVGTIPATTASPTENFLVGHMLRGGADYSDSTKEEIRVSTITRTEAWCKAEYHNMNAPGTFCVEGTPESPAVTEYIPKVIMIT